MLRAHGERPIRVAVQCDAPLDWRGISDICVLRPRVPWGLDSMPPYYNVFGLGAAARRFALGDMIVLGTVTNGSCDDQRLAGHASPSTTAR